MSSKSCPTCQEFLPPDRESLPICSRCQLVFHFGNCSAVNEPGWVKRGKEAQAAWVCHRCNPKKKMGNSNTPVLTQTTHEMPINSNLQFPVAENTSSSKKRARTSFGSPPHTIPEFKSIEEKLDYVMDLAITALKNQDQMFEELRGIRSDVTAVQQRTSELAVRVSVLEKKAEDSAAKIYDLEQKNRALEDYSRANNLIFHGGPTVKDDAEATKFVLSVAKASNFVMTDRDIVACHTLGVPRNGTARIVCRFTNRWQKNRLVAAVKEAKLTTTDLTDPSIPGEPRKIFVTDHLSPETAKFLAEAKRILLTRFGGNYDYVWTKNRRVFIRTREKQPVTELKSYAQLYNLQSTQIQHMEGVQHSQDGTLATSQ